METLERDASEESGWKLASPKKKKKKIVGEEAGWKLASGEAAPGTTKNIHISEKVHGDVFRPPPHLSLLRYITFHYITFHYITSQ